MLQVSINSFSYDEKPILQDINFTLKAGEHLSILGESGCGKSTLLHLIYGLLHLQNGTIFYNQKQLLGPTNTLIPGEPFIKLVAQEYNIMPFTTVAENIGNNLSGLDAENDAMRISALLAVVELENFKNKLVKNLSGGQKQRVALAKALAKKPELLLLDEPFSNIDNFRKNKLRRKIFNYLREEKIACITATQDSDEALSFSDTILMLNNGKIDMFGTPQKIYENIETNYQAGFFGDVTILPENLFATTHKVKKSLYLPHQLRLSEIETSLYVSIKRSYFKGSNFLILATWQGKNIFFEHPKALSIGKNYFVAPSQNF